MSRRQRKSRNNSGNKYAVQPDTPPPCPHAEKSITPNKVKNNFPHAVFGRCSECTIREKIYLCLKCGKQFCTTHGDKHFDLNNHSLNYELDTGIVRCSKCARELPTQSHSSIERVCNIIGDFLKKQNSVSGTVSPKKAAPVPMPVEQKLTNGNVDHVKNSVTEARVTEHHVAGLKNTGVICFFNSVLQNLVQTPMLRACINYTCDNYKETLQSKTYGSVHIDVPSCTSTSMVSKYLSFLKLLDSKERTKAIHAFQVFQEMCSYNGCLSDGQQDAQEAFHAIVHCMSSEESKRRKNAVLQTFGVMRATFKDLPKEKKKKITEFANIARGGTFIDSLFGGTTMNQITCLTCSSITKTLDHFVDLSVPLPKKEDSKPRSKQKSSGEGGLSKHQKKKQQKENRKKGKKGRDRKDSNCPPQSPSEVTSNEAENEQKSPDSVSPPGDSSPVTENGNMDPEKDAEDECSIPEVRCEDISLVMSSADTDTECLETTAESVTIAPEDIDVEMEDCGLADINVESNNEDVPLTDEKISTDDSTAKGESNINSSSEVGEKLKGGYSAACESDDDNEGLFSLFQEDESSSNGIKSSVENLANLMDDLDIDDADIGKNTLEACLAQFCREELLTDDNQFSCINCAKQTIDNNSLNVSCARSTDSSLSEDENTDDSDCDEKIKPILRDAKCRYFLNTLPPILVVHLKRFTQDHKGFLIKDRRNISYPLELDLDKFTISGSGNKYKLFGVVEHSGTLHRGHYTAYVRKRDTSLDEIFMNKTVPLAELINLLGSVNAEKATDFDKWYYCNDERISETTVKKALDADAYLLFYERCLPYS